MKRTIIGLAALALVFSASAAEAQKPISFGVALGASMPMGDFGDAAGTGWHAGGVLAIAPATMPVGFRVDATYNSLGFSDDMEAFAGESGSWSVIAVNGNVTWNIPMTGSPIAPYLLGGVGMYRLNTDLDGSEAEQEFGFNLGAGTKFNLSGFSTFAEIRYHTFSVDDADFNYLPISFGIMF